MDNRYESGTRTAVGALPSVNKRGPLAWLAKCVRIVSVPPLMMAVVMALLALATDAVFRAPAEALLTILFLGGVPLLAYPLSGLLPRIKKRGREGQRDLAFALSVAGYAGGWLWSCLTHALPALMAIFTAYLFTVLSLLVFNKLLFLRASGHAAGITGPILLALWFVGGFAVPAGLAVYAAVFWASVYAGRHTHAEFLAGTALCAASTVIAFLLYLL